jgi:hypothetical protein
MPLYASMISGLPYFACVTRTATNMAAAAARRTFVAPRLSVCGSIIALDAITRTSGSSIAASTYGTQPASISMTPTEAIGALWPGMKFDERSRLYFPVRAPTSTAPAAAHKPPATWMTDAPA